MASGDSGEMVNPGEGENTAISRRSGKTSGRVKGRGELEEERNKSRTGDRDFFMP